MSRQSDQTTLRKIISRFGNARVLVIGDLMWDEYIVGDCSRISPEAPVPVVLLSREYRVPGGATNVLKNLVDLKVPTGLIGIVGADKNGREMIRELGSWHLKYTQVWESHDRPTTIKTRILARNQQLMRLDREESHPISPDVESKILKGLKQHISQFNVIILSDYGKGMFTPALISGIIEMARHAGVYVAVDPQVRNFRHYKHANILTPNEKEASEGVNAPFPKKEKELKEIGRLIREQLHCEDLLITRSERGMALFEKDNHPVYVPTVAREVFDVSGAGDTVIAVFSAATGAGATRLQATLLSNFAGGVVVGKIGTASLNRKELSDSIRSDVLKKIQEV